MKHMNVYRYTLSAVAALCLAGTPAFAGPDFEPGEWQMTSQSEMSGMQMQMPAQTYTMCLTKEHMTPNNPQQQNCEITEQHTSGNTLSWTMICTTNGQASTIKGEATYSGDTMESTIFTHSQGMQMTTHTTGKRLGPCR